MADKPRPTMADYTAIALSPLLIMALIGSLVHFLVAILYDGDFTERLRYILFWYVFGMVLVARMSMEFGISDRAPLYGGILALATLLGLGQFVEYPAGLAALSWPVNIGFIALIWWSAYRLTYDCTYIDEKAESTGTGLLQAAGLDNSQGQDATTPTAQPEDNGKRRKKKDANPGWWERFQRQREERKKTKPPGVWVVYFSLAALPIFGLGQSLIDPEDVDRRRRVFWLMAIYVASGLGLLVTTAFLGLRRYLRQRNLEMPKKMTAAWLTAGAALILAFLVVGALLPRPDAEYSLLDLTRLGSKERDASDYALKDGEAGKGEGRPGEQRLDKDGRPVNTGDPKAQGNGGKGEAKGQGGSGDKSQQGQQGQQGDKSGENAKGKPADQKGEGEKGQGKKEDKADGGDRGGREGSPQAQAKKSARGGSTKGTTKSSGSPSSLGNIATVVKWIVFAIIVVAVVVFLLRGGLRYLANFFEWARRLLESLQAFWEGLFGRREAAAAGDESEEEEQRAEPRPFRWYRNPFHDGRAEEMSAAELVRYSFEAMEAWAFEHDLPRMTDETPIEFADRVGGDAPALESEAKRLAALYARVLYAKGGLPVNWRAVVEQFWEKMEAAAEQPLSA
jgi:Domain of unknown function (DUF4129)